jgi:geranylgeranyl pyrophosphate synthase
MASEHYLVSWREAVHSALVSTLHARCETASRSSQDALQRLWSAMQHGVLNGGKRTRGLLVMAACQAAGGNPLGPLALRLACVLELIHAFSLVHDDMPCMDDDDLRRGQPTVHIAFDEPTALLVGDALQSLAFQLVAESEEVPAPIVLRMVGCLAEASGADGMAGGQAIDIYMVGKQLDQPGLEDMHRLKTGALIRAAAEMGAWAGPGGQDPVRWQKISAFAQDLGLAFQVVDDYLDATASTEILGKTAGKDQAADKPTFVGLLGLEGCKGYAEQLHSRALGHIADLGPQAQALRDLAHQLTHRQH